VLLGVMLSVALVAIDATILATAVPSVVEDLGGFSQFPWLFSIYLLAQAISVPLYGKFSDIIGRKPVMLLGIALFLLGSVLCGVAWSMPSLIVFRAVQGLGAGAVLPMSMTIIGDLYSIAERSKVQGYVASVWGVSSVVGPTLGGVFSDYLSWRWIFFVNVPIAIAAALMLARRFREDVTRTHHRIDYAGAVTLAIGGSLLILGLLEGGVEWAWDSTASISVLATAAVLLAGFVLIERRAAEPILPLWVFRRRVLVGANASSLVVGVLLIGLTSYVPLYAQGVLGTNALVGGFVVAAMTIGWPISAAIARPLLPPRRVPRHGVHGICVRGRRSGPAGARHRRQLDLLPRRRLLRHRRRPRLHRLTDPGRCTVLGRLDNPWRRHRHHDVRPLGGQRARHRRVRRHRQRRRRPPGQRFAPRPGAPAGPRPGAVDPRGLPRSRSRRDRHDRRDRAAAAPGRHGRLTAKPRGHQHVRASVPA